MVYCQWKLKGSGWKKKENCDYFIHSVAFFLQTVTGMFNGFLSVMAVSARPFRTNSEYKRKL